MNIIIKHPIASRLRIYALLLMVALSAGCSASGKFFESTVPEDMNLNIPAETLVKKGLEEYRRGKYFVALEYFNKILDSYRFTPQALLAELKVADCSYYMGRYTEAYSYYERYEEMHPTNEAIPYVMYQKAMCFYSRIDTIDRDISAAKKAIERFQLLLKAYPDSAYTEDAKAKILSSKEFLANHEFNVAKFYQRTDKNRQATLRLKYLIAMYPNTDIVPRAKNLLAELEAEQVESD